MKDLTKKERNEFSKYIWGGLGKRPLWWEIPSKSKSLSSSDFLKRKKKQKNQKRSKRKNR